MEALLISILVTLLCDVYLQGSGTVELRKDGSSAKNRCIGNLVHFAQIFIPFTIIIGVLYSRHISFINVIRYTSLISIIHILIDIIKCWTFKVVTDENKFKFLKAYNLVSDKKIFNIGFGEDILFLVDQILHLIFTILIFANSKLMNLRAITYIDQPLFYKILLFIIVFIYTVRCGELFIDLFFEKAFKNIKQQTIKDNSKEESINRLVCSIDRVATYFALNNGGIVEEYDEFNEQIDEPAITEETDESKKNDENISRYIGILERSIVIILVICNNYSSIALLLTGKSLARMGDFKDRDFAVKFIVGTFLSIFIGIVGGETYKFILNNFIM